MCSKSISILPGHADVLMGVLCLNNDEMAEKLRFLQCGMYIKLQNFHTYICIEISAVLYMTYIYYMQVVYFDQ